MSPANCPSGDVIRRRCQASGAINLLRAEKPFIPMQGEANTAQMGLQCSVFCRSAQHRIDEPEGP
eukprot:7699009-Prorocentrum_lima.AAC.1